jgi:hypothetical protein
MQNAISPKDWPYAFTVKLLKVPMIQLRRDYQQALCSKPDSVKQLDQNACMPWIENRLNELVSWAKVTPGTINHELMKAWHLPYNTQSVAALEYACDAFTLKLYQLVEWERGVASVIGPSPAWNHAFGQLHGSTSVWLEQLSAFPLWLEAELNKPKGESTAIFNPCLESPQQLLPPFVNLVRKAYNENLPFWKRKPFATAAIGAALLLLCPT